jgi:hypothetical protein
MRRGIEWRTDGGLTPAMITRRSAAEVCLAARDGDRSRSVSDNTVAYRSGTKSPETWVEESKCVCCWVPL